MHRGYRSAVFSLESPQIFFVIFRNSPIEMQILRLNLPYLNSPLEILRADFRSRHFVGIIVGKNIKFSNRIPILRSNANSPVKTEISKFSNRIPIPRSPRVPEILRVNVKKGLLRNKPISKDHTLYYYTPLRPLEPRVPRAL